MSLKFEGNVPDIKIQNLDPTFFIYTCVDTQKSLNHPCSNMSPLSEKCFDCIGFNKRFGRYFKDNNRCICGSRVDFGYFILIFLLSKAELLIENFKITCCRCYPYEDIEIVSM